jgi:hypothetical protein
MFIESTTDTTTKVLQRELVNAWHRMNNAKDRGDKEGEKIARHTWGVLHNICRDLNIEASITKLEISHEAGA